MVGRLPVTLYHLAEKRQTDERKLLKHGGRRVGAGTVGLLDASLSLRAWSKEPSDWLRHACFFCGTQGRREPEILCKHRAWHYAWHARMLL